MAASAERDRAADALPRALSSAARWSPLAALLGSAVRKADCKRPRHCPETASFVKLRKAIPGIVRELTKKSFVDCSEHVARRLTVAEPVPDPAVRLQAELETPRRGGAREELAQPLRTTASTDGSRKSPLSGPGSHSDFGWSLVVT